MERNGGIEAKNSESKKNEKGQDSPSRVADGDERKID